MSKHKKSDVAEMMAEITEYLCNECYWDLPCEKHGRR